MSTQPKRVPLNTAAAAHTDPEMRSWVLGGNPDAIVAQEAAGQKLFVNSDTLPTKTDADSQKVLEAAGVKFGSVVPGDPSFQYVELPPGWKKARTDHSMWSKLVDEKGRTRAMIFYKAAFYDRRAKWDAERRYSFRLDYERRERDGITVCHVRDANTVIYTTDEFKPTPDVPDYEVETLVSNTAVAWLNEHYPNWGDPAAYWD